MRNNFLVFGQPEITQNEIDEVVDTMRSGWLGTGPKVKRFEKDFAAYKGVSEAAALHSCTAALHVSLLAANIGVGDEVITTPLTFVATVNTIIHAGATPILVDVDPLTMNIDPKAIEAAITPKTKAIIPVHLTGRACDMNAIMTISEKHNLTVIEDAAHAIETEYHGKKAGTIGDYGCFSFYSTKNLSTGEGGMIITKHTDRMPRIRQMTSHGLSADAHTRFSSAGYKHYFAQEAGFKYNMMDLQAAMGIHQLARLEESWKRREVVWNIYQGAFKDLPVRVPTAVEPNTRHAYHLYTLLVDEEYCGLSRDKMLEELKNRNIGCGVHYLSVAEHPFHQNFLGVRPEDTPNATRIGRQTLSLPISAKLTDYDVSSVVEAVRDILKG